MNAQAKLRPTHSFGLVTRLFLLAAVLLAVGLVAIFVALQFQVVDLNMAIFGLIVCVISSQLAHIVGEFPSGDDYFVARLAASISVRTGLPMLAVVFAKLSPNLHFEPAFVFFVILFYLVGLFVDVALHVSRLKSAE